MLNTHITTEFRQGALPPGIQLPIDGNFNVLIGPNDVGKTSILLLLFRKYAQTYNKGKTQTCLILPERFYTDTTMQPGGRSLEAYNSDLLNTITDNNRSYSRFSSPSAGELPRLLLHHTSFLPQIQKLNDLLRLFGFKQIDLIGPQEVIMENVTYATHGSGSRSLLPILCALTDDRITLLLIDEPEISLEARLQKLLRDLLNKESQNKKIIISTHSHLFLNRVDYKNNYIVAKNNEQVSIREIASKDELYDITFKMLGNSVEDLFFPKNFIIVEGPSDQIIVNKIISLKGINENTIKVIAASGLENVSNIYFAVCNTLTPIVLPDSPYKDSVVSLIDKPVDPTNHNYLEIKRILSDRTFELTENSIEKYLPEEIYTNAGRIKEDEIRKIDNENDYIKKGILKKELSIAIAESLKVENLPQIKIINDAVDKAVS